MVELIGKQAGSEELSRFLGEFRRALMMHRKARLALMFRLHFPVSDAQPYVGYDTPESMDFRSWLSAPPPAAVRTDAMYQRLVAAQEQLIHAGAEALAAAHGDRLQPATVADFLQAVHQFERVADRLASWVTASMTDVDELTGLLNRTAMERDLAREQAQLLRTGGKVTVAMVDADHFKQVNDDHGHAFGDHVLQTLAERFVESLRPRDQVYRYGGEEFLLLLPDTPLDKAAPVLERLRLRAAEDNISDGKTVVNLTVSVGATAVKPDENIHAAIDRADAALYRAKEAGRNRVELDTEAE